MITCRELIDFIGSYISNELSREERIEFHRHLAVCPACHSYLENYKKTIALGKAAFAPTDDPVPNEVPEDLVKAILAARKKAQ